MFNRLHRAFAVIFILILVVWGMPALAGGPVFNHDLQVTLHPAHHRLEAVDRVVLSGHASDRLVFMLGAAISVDRVMLNGQSVKFRYSGGRLTIPTAGVPADPTVTIAYRGVFDDPAPVQPLNTDNPGFGVTGTIEEKGTMLLAGAGWYPDAQGIQTFRISVDAPRGVLAVTSGTLLGHSVTDGRSVSRWSVEAPVRGLSLVAGRYTVKTATSGDVTAATYFSDEIQGLSDSYLDASIRYLEMYTDLFGPYAFGRFAVVENFFPTGYGFPGFTLMGRRVLQLPFIPHTSLGHEVAHCWWGNGVLVDPSQGNWSEGLTTYVADYLYKERRGQGLAHRRQWLRNYASLVGETNELALSRFMGRTDPTTKAIGYDKAAMVFHMLRRQVGEATFWDSLRQIYARYRFKAITWSHIQTVFETRSGLSLVDFFDQWVFRPGAPALTLAQVKASADDGGYAITGSVVQKKPYYDLPIDVELRTSVGTHVRTIEARGPRTAFRLDVPDPPQRLTMDPQVHLFRRLAPSELPPTINRLKGSDNVNVVVAHHLEGRAMNLARRLAVALGLYQARIGTPDAFTDQDLARADVIFLGMPDGRPWQADASVGFSADENRIDLLGEHYPSGISSFFGVFTNARNPERLAAVFIPGDASSASVVSSKIPHYGKYSYLVFKGSKNRVKGTWAADKGPLVVRWGPGPTLLSEGGGQ